MKKLLGTILWNASEFLGVRCPFGHVVLGWMLGAKPTEKNNDRGRL